MATDPELIERWKQARESILAAERETELIGAIPEFRTKYAGQWVVVQGGRVVASSPSGAELAQVANINTHPNAVFFYVPALEVQRGIFIPSFTVGNQSYG